MKKNISIILLLSMVAMIFTGCSYELEPTEHDANIEKLESSDGVEIPSLTQTIAVPNEEFSLECVYDTGKYELGSWRITDSKEMTMNVRTVDLPEGYEVFIDHVHADISLHGDRGEFNGIKQDEMDDTFHGYSQPGFYINNETNYKNIFSIEGYTNEFLEIAGYYAYGYGYMTSTEHRITEMDLRDWGINAEKLMVVFDLNVKAPEDTYYHTVSVSTEMLIPVSEEKKYLTSTQEIEGVEYTLYYDENDEYLKNPLFGYDKDGNKYSAPGVLWEDNEEQ